jgi:hypothetical protein
MDYSEFTFIVKNYLDRRSFGAVFGFSSVFGPLLGGVFTGASLVHQQGIP